MGYDSIAEAYDRFVRNRTMIHQLTVPAVMALCVGTGRVLDVACGQGVVTRELAAAGFDVTGTDIAEALLDIARAEETASPHGITYVHDDACLLEHFEAGSFDGVTANLAINDVDDLPAFMSSIARVLKPGGWFVFSGMHPCFWSPASMELEAPGGRQTMYYQEGRWWREGVPTGPVGKLGYQHRTLSTVLNTLGRAGLVLDHVEEPKAENRDVPTVIVMRAVKPGLS